MSFFLELSLLLGVTVISTIVVRLLKQPLVVGYILSGIIAGPFILNVLHSTEELEFFSKVGIVFLLFIVGLHLNPKVIKEVGSVSIITGIGQVVFTSLIGFAIILALGIDFLPAIYVAIALTFSSTIVILKLLADKKDLQKLYAKIAIGVLLVQDIIATLVLIGVTIFANGSSETILMTLFVTTLKGVGVCLILFFFSRFILSKAIAFLATSQELLFLFSLAYGTGLASLFYLLGFSIEIGALVAGVTLSMTPFADEISSRLKPIRDFFIILFFILLGSQVTLSNLSDILFPTLVLSLFVLIGNPIIVIIIMHLIGYSRRTSFFAGLTVAQISEFSLILASLGLRIGHVSQEIMSLVTLVGLITIAGSTYLILYSEHLYHKMQFVLEKFEVFRFKKTKRGGASDTYANVLFGFDKAGMVYEDLFRSLGKDFLVVDYNPKLVEHLEQRKLAYKLGDANDVEFLDELPIEKPFLVISTITDFTTNKLILRNMLERNNKAILILHAQNNHDATALYNEGASYVFIPAVVGAEQVTRLIKKHGFDAHLLAEFQKKHQLQPSY